MDFRQLFHSNPSELVCLVESGLKDYLSYEAKCLLNQSNDLKNLSHARLKVLAGLGFKSNYHLSKFINQLKADAAERLSERDGSEGWLGESGQNEPHSLFYSEFSLCYPEKMIAEARLLLGEPHCVSYQTVASINSIEMCQPVQVDPDEAFRFARDRDEAVRVLKSFPDLKDWRFRSGGFALVPFSLIGVEGILPKMFIQRVSEQCVLR